MRNHDFDAFLKKDHIFCGKMDVAATVAPKGLGLKTDQKVGLGPLAGLLGQPLFRKLVFKKFGPERPLILTIKCTFSEI